MDNEQLRERITTQLRTLRDANDQKSAVAWMRDAYLLLEASLLAIDKPAPSVQVVASAPWLVTPETKVYCLPSSPLRNVWFKGQTMVYADPPEFLRKPQPEPVLLTERGETIAPRKPGKRKFKPSHTYQYGRG